jgi:uncharacterized metal-binding protein
MKKDIKAHCASCESKDCRDGKDCYAGADQDLVLYHEENLSKLHKAASAIEAGHYCKATRLEEIILFAREMEYRRLGLAFCIGLAEEAWIVEEVIRQDFEVISVCCKICGIPKKMFKLDRIHTGNENEVMCNPAGQGRFLNEADTDLNIVCGLCVGHDAIFSKVSEAPVTTLIAKDRVLAHNPAGALYSRYIRTKLLSAGQETN